MLSTCSSRVIEMKIIKKPKKSGLFLVGLALIVSLFFLAILLEPWGGTTQPILFNHKIHAENGLGCEDCHTNFMKFASSGRPKLETCTQCHEETLTESKEEKRLSDYIQEGKEIDWIRLFHIPDDVYFSHRLHVVIGKIECSVCHGDIGESTQPPSKVQNLSMDKCMDCHEKRQVNNDCIACHR